MQSLKKNWLLVPKMRKVWKFALSCATFVSKVYYVWAEKVQRSYLSEHRRMMQNLKRNWLKLWGMTWEILQLLTQHSKVSKFAFYRLLLTKVYNVWAKMYSWSTSPEHSKILKFALWEIFLSKVYNVELKHYREVLCHNTEGWCNI